MTVDAPVAPLSQQMRERSREDHEEAESSGFVTDLVEGRIPASGYVAYLRRLHRVYTALETAGRALGDHPAALAVLDPRLEREARLAADLDHWSPGWPAHPVDSPATSAYEARLASIGEHPVRLVAHHYTRYLGDLAGGQVVGRAVERHHSFSPGAGLAFYDFSEVGKVKPYRDDYRLRLDALPLDASQVEDVVQEVRLAFRLNRALFVELGEQQFD